MRNDDPTNLRRGFGYLEARASGVTGFESPPNSGKMSWHLECAAAEKRIAELSNADPSIIPFLLDLRAKLKEEEQNSAPWLLANAYWERPDLAPPGYWDKYPDWGVPEKVRATRKDPPQSN
jgi:hypothetical protein